MNKGTLQQEYTSPALAKKMMGMIKARPGMSVLEPSVGGGELAAAIISRLDVGSLTLVDIDNDNINAVKSRFRDSFNIKYIHGDFIKYADSCSERFDSVIMAPPFLDGHGALHVAKAYELLKNGGQLCALISTNWLNETHVANQHIMSIQRSSSITEVQTLREEFCDDKSLSLFIADKR